MNMKIAMCWKCSNVNTVLVEDQNVPCSTMTGCKAMTQKAFDEAAERNGGGIPGWEDCPLNSDSEDLVNLVKEKNAANGDVGGPIAPGLH